MRKFKKIISILLMIALSEAYILPIGQAAAWLNPLFQPPGKLDVGVDDDENLDKVIRTANVLFLLDTSHPMMFDASGRMPYMVGSGSTIDQTATRNLPIYSGTGYSFTDIVNLVKHATFGVGTLLVRDSYFTTTVNGRNHRGRDTDPTNNLRSTDSAEVRADKLSKYYYSPDPDNPYKLVFKDESNWGTIPSSFTDDHLMPNDSRLYQTKLVLWKLLGNRRLFENIRFGLATSYSNGFPGHATTGYGSGNAFVSGDPPAPGSPQRVPASLRHMAYKAPNFDEGVNTTTGGTTINWPHGTYYITEEGIVWNGDSTLRQVGTWGLMSSPWASERGTVSSTTSDATLRSRLTQHAKQYNHFRRGFLRVPIAHYETEWKTINQLYNEANPNAAQRATQPTMTQTARFRQWIDGDEDIAGYLGTGATSNSINHTLNGGQLDIHRNPELKVSSTTALSRIIYPNPGGYTSTSLNTIINDLTRAQLSGDNPYGETSMAVGPSRNWHLNNSGVGYAKRSSIFHSPSVSLSRTTTRDLYNFYFKPGSGQAVGTVIDFFSPDYATFHGAQGNGLSQEDFYTNGSNSSSSTTNSGNNRRQRFADMIDEQFPIRDTCDPNYLVVLTAGDAIRDTYSTAQAIQNLYEHTDKTRTGAPRVTKMSYQTINGTRQRTFEQVHLDQPIKTIVVGFVPDDGSNQTAGLRESLVDMANAGEGNFGNGRNSPGYTADTAQLKNLFFASNVEQLMDALHDVMIMINHEIQPSKGSMLEDASFEEQTDGGDMDLYAGGFRYNFFDQWEGKLTKYETTKTIKATGEIEIVTEKVAELGEKILEVRNNRPLRIWDGTGNKFNHSVLYTPGTARTNPDAHPLAELVGLGNVRNVMETPSYLGQLTPAAARTRFENQIHPSRALFNWYFGWDVSYVDGNPYERRYMLSDQGKSGIIKVGQPNEVKSLPGYQEFAKEWGTRWTAQAQQPPTRLYVQTNDGVLHVVNPDTMREQLAILPPPTLLPGRMLGLKTTLNDNGWYKWTDVKDYNAVTSDDIPISSRPLYTLDGPLQKRDFDLGAAGTPSGNWQHWKSLVFGSLGKGGSGLYVIDATEPDDPNFYWYRETVEHFDENDSLSLIWRGQGGATPTGHAATPYHFKIERRDNTYWENVLNVQPNIRQSHAYEQLAFNPPKPYFSVADLAVGSDGRIQKNLIAMSGGTQRKLDLMNNNGKMGAAFYLVDPHVSHHNNNLNPRGSESSPLDGVRVFNSGSLQNAGAAWQAGTELFGKAPYMGMVTSEPAFLAAINDKYKAWGALFADNRGSIFYVNFVDQNNTPYTSWNDWGIRTIASLRVPQDDVDDRILPSDSIPANYSIPAGLMGDARFSSPEDVWIAGGTANVARGEIEREQYNQWVPNESQQIPNKEQMIFAFKMPDLYNPREVGNPPINKSGKTTRDDWTEVDADDASGIEPGDEGWYIPLRKAENGYNAEYASTRPFLFQGVLFVATFREDKAGRANPEACDANNLLGETRLYALSLDTGRPMLWGNRSKKYLDFDGIKVTGFTLSEAGGTPMLLAAYHVLDKDNAGSNIDKNTGSEDSLSSVGGDLNALAIRLPEEPTPGTIPPNEGVLTYWRYHENVEQ